MRNVCLWYSRPSILALKIHPKIMFFKTPSWIQFLLISCWLYTKMIDIWISSKSSGRTIRTPNRPSDAKTVLFSSLDNRLVPVQTFLFLTFWSPFGSVLVPFWFQLATFCFTFVIIFNDFHVFSNDLWTDHCKTCPLTRQLKECKTSANIGQHLPK